MKLSRLICLMGVLLPAPAVLTQQTVAAQAAGAPAADANAEQVLVLANQARAGQSVGLLKWDPALAAAALRHCQRMAVEGPIAHRYNGELDLTERAGQAGAHFSLIEENVAVGASAEEIHDAWMHSPGHRDNLLNPQVNRVGVAVVAHAGVLYAVADYARGVDSLNPEQVEAAVGQVLRAKGLTVLKDTVDARGYCSNGARGPSGPSFLMVWQNSDPAQLPTQLLERLGPHRFLKAAVGSCPPHDVEGPFTVYRVAVLLY